MLRQPIKIRRPIFREFCTCHNVNVVTIKRVPQLVIADHTTADELEKFIKSINVCTPIHIINDSSIDFARKLILITQSGIPAIVHTNRVLSQVNFNYLTKVMHSGLHVSISFPEGNMRNHLDPKASSIRMLREMMNTAKIRKLFVALHVDYYPHLMSHLDIYEIVDMIKNSCGHMLLKFPEIKDADLSTFMEVWSELKPSSVESFKQFYTAHVPSRSWRVKESYKQSVIEGIREYLKAKKVNMELLPEGKFNDRIRHVPNGTSNLPLGIRAYHYEKVNGLFEPGTLDGETPCSECGRTLFT